MVVFIFVGPKFARMDGKSNMNMFLSTKLGLVFVEQSALSVL